MPATMRGLGTSQAELTSMSNVQQLEYVYKYYKGYAGRMKDIYALYLVTFFPALLTTNYNNDTVIEGWGLSAATIARANPGLDLNSDGKITVGEFNNSIDVRLRRLGISQNDIDNLKKKTM